MVEIKSYKWLILFWIVFTSMSVAQDTSSRSLQLEREILMTEDTDMEVLAKGRKLILSRINQDSIQRAVEVMNYLDSRYQSTRIMPFWQGEREIISIWTRQYNYLLKTENLEPRQDDGYRQRIVPPRDLFSQELQQKAVREKSKLLAGIFSSNLADDEKQFIELLVATWIVDRNDQRKAQDSLNALSNRFIYGYPHSKYTHYVRKYIRFVYIPSEWSYGFDLSFGYIGIGGVISQYFNDAGALAFGFDISYKKLVFYPRISVGFGSAVKKTFYHPPSALWNKDLKIQFFIPELSVGYMLIENDFIRLAPFAGITGVLIEPPENEKKNTGSYVKLNSDVSFIGGLNMDLRIGSFGIPFISYNEKSDWTIKFRLEFIQPSYSGTNSVFSGSAVCFTIGVGGIGRAMNRDE